MSDQGKTPVSDTHRSRRLRITRHRCRSRCGDQMAQAEQIRADIATVSAPADTADRPRQRDAAPAGRLPRENSPAGGRADLGAAGTFAAAAASSRRNKANQALARAHAAAGEADRHACRSKGRRSRRSRSCAPSRSWSLKRRSADYGDDFLQVVGKRAKEEFAPEVRRAGGSVEAAGGPRRGCRPGHREDARSTTFTARCAARFPTGARSTVGRVQAVAGSTRTCTPAAKRHDMLKEAFC